MKNRTAILSAIAVLVLAFWLLKKPAPESESAPHSREAPAPPETPPVPAPKSATALPPPPVPRAAAPEPWPAPDPDEVARKRSLAKVSLAAGYAAAKSFHAEYGRYSTDLRALGWQPGESWMEAKMGFVAEYNPAATVGREEPRNMDTDIYVNEKNASGEAYAYRRPAGELSLANYASLCKAGCTAGENGFELMVAVPLDENGRVDVWTINDKKEMTMVRDGTKSP